MKFTNLFVIIAILLWSSPFDAAEISVKLDAGANETESSDLTAAQALEFLSAENDVIVLDVRTPQEFSAGHIEGALNLDIKQDGFKERLAKLEKGNAFLVHCASGRRSQLSVAIMEELGFENIYHLDGGFNAWKQAGNPVAIEDDKE